MSTYAQRIEVELFGRPLEQIADYCQEYCSSELQKISLENEEWEYFIFTDKSAVAINWSRYEMQIKSRAEVADDMRNSQLNMQNINEQRLIPVDLMPAADLRERLLKKISSIDAVLNESWKWTGRTREIVMRVDRGDINLARVTYPSNSGRRPTGIVGMKTGGRKYNACLQLLAQLQSNTVLYN
ncbi:hypothetical protein LNV23_22785 [Paucibacter sp. DJ1R-11]|uniref:hypothetical protein n=1 Tax=Paucibacter sp. DJ1R-11 TaxID=2893556 RepID=UPI0021E3E8C9|nr:hypothetical protein [Paucibacter sp. DJ1R-11]MCV2366272.1 hypothetical protein [Paucibacter sp. DJ1R-11]